MSSKKYRWGYKYQGESEPCIGTAGFCGTKSNLYGMVFWHMSNFLYIFTDHDPNRFKHGSSILKKGSKLKKKIYCNFFQLAWIRIWVSHNTWIRNTSPNYGRYNIYINSDLIAQATSTRKAKNGIFFNWLIIYTYFLIKTKLRSIRYLFKYGMNAKEIEGESEWRFQDYSLF